MNAKLLRLSGTLLVVGFIAACRSAPAAPPGEQPAILTVSAASSLTPAFQEIGRQYTAETGSEIALNFGSTGQLAQQIAQGAPVDLFASADVASIDDLERQGRIVPGTEVQYARGRITLWVPEASPLEIRRVEELARPEVRRIAIANPDHAPYGIAAREALQSVGLWDTLQPKLVLGENVRQALQYAETGNVDVAIVPLSLSLDAGGRYVLIPEALHRPLEQALAVIRGTQHEREARDLAAFITGPQGSAILRKFGYVKPEGAPEP